jgi:hypothetical protein
MANERKLLTVEDCKSIIGSLANSQGFYGRLYQHLEENGKWDELATAAQKANCHDMVDLVLFLEQ